MPDPDRHVHIVLFNLTYDAVEREWKAVKFRPIMDDRKFFDRRFDLRFSHKLAELGYGIETKYKADGKGGRRYYSWDIAGMPASVVAKFSRRTQEVNEAEKATIEANRERDKNLGRDPSLTSDTLSMVARDKLGATSRLSKRKDLTVGDCRTYWDQKVTPEEARQIAELQQTAMGAEKTAPVNTADMAVAFAIGHSFERNSVVDWHDLAVAAMERCMGAARPEDIESQARRQGVLLKDGEATTADVLAEEQRIIGFARAGRGVYQPLGSSKSVSEAALAGLSADQKAVVRHIWQRLRPGDPD